MSGQQKGIDEYAFCVEFAEEQPRNCNNWDNRLSSIEKWILKETAICKRVLRLRSYAYLKIPWFLTSIAWYSLLRNHNLCTVPGNSRWITAKKYVNANGDLLNKHREIFEQKKQIYNQWVKASLPLGYHAERVYTDAFNKAGYSAKKVKVPSPDNKEAIELDIYGIKDGLQVGVQVKNGLSEVFMDPRMIHNPPIIYQALHRQFEFCSKNGIVPILLAPFFNKRFYNFTKRHQGLHCQTYLQLFSPEYAGLCNAVREILKFGNVRVATEAPEHVARWIQRIPRMWSKRYKQ